MSTLRPNHYAQTNSIYEPGKVIRAWGLSFHLGNALKYIYRAPYKGHDVEDLKKAITYLQDEVNYLEGNPGCWSAPYSDSDK